MHFEQILGQREGVFTELYSTYEYGATNATYFCVPPLCLYGHVNERNINGMYT